MLEWMRLLLIRHGQTPSNVIGALDTARPGAELTPLGLVQAAAIPQALQNESIRAIFASPLTRTQLTAAPLAAARDLEVQIIEGLEEISAGDLEMRNDLDSAREYVDSAWQWATGDLEPAVPGGEDGHAFFARYDAAIAQIAEEHPDATVAAVSHGAAIRVWAAARAEQTASTPGAAERRLENTGMCVLEGDPVTGWTLREWIATPLGGQALEDHLAHDVTGDPEEAEATVRD